MRKQAPEPARKKIQSLIAECRKIIVGKTDLVENLLAAILAEGHVMLEGVPGVAKTTIAKTFSGATGLKFTRIQGSSDILPADIVGTHVFDPKTGSFMLAKGPIFSNILLIDEINRNTPKTNGAVLEAMEEKQVTIEGETQKLPYPFLVIATESPIEFHGVFPLPEVLVDRFLFSLKVDYPSLTEELEIVDHIHAREAATIDQVATSEQISDLAQLAKQVYVAPPVQSYLVDLTRRTRTAEGISLGASPRASIALHKASRARAFIEGRMYVLPDDVKYLAPRVFNHRIVLSSSGRSEQLTTESIMGKILEETPIPERLQR